jgi:hypothetical protein
MALIIFGAFALCFLTDFLNITMSQMQIEKAVADGLDAAIIASTEEYQHQRGNQELDMVAAEQALRSTLQKNLKLESSLNNKNFVSSDLHVSVTYLSGTNRTPRLESTFNTKIKLIAGRLFGITDYPMSITRKTPYLGEFM